jgi:chitodextrinase
MLSWLILPCKTQAAGVPTFVQKGDTQISSGSRSSVTFSNSNTAGNLIVAYVVWDNSYPVSVSDARGNSYVSAIGPTRYSGGQARAQIFYARNIAGGSNTVTATFGRNIAAFGSFYVHEYAGLDRASPLSAAVARTGSSTSMNSGYLSTTSPNTLLFAGGLSGGSVTAPGSGYAARSTAYGRITEDKIAVSAGSYNATATQNGGAWILQFLVFKAAGAAIDATPPTVPTGLSASVVSPSQSNLSWNPSTDDVAVTGYKVFRNGTQIATVTTGTSYQNTNLSPNTTYTYTVSAYDQAGNNSARSAGVAVTTPASVADTMPPSVPANIQASGVTQSGTTISWTASTDNVAVAGYFIYRDSAQISATEQTAFNETGLAASTTYIYSVAAFDGAGNISARSTPLSVTTQSAGSSMSYSTNFPLTENPISDGGNWINGKTNGLDWADVASIPGLAMGTESGSGGYDDATAILIGPWGPDQTVQATVHSVNQNPNETQEVEIRLRSAITAHSNTGYEINFLCLNSSSAYTQIVRWNGPLGDFTVLAGGSGAITEGTVVKATMTGNLITVYINGVQIYHVVDNTYTSGNPGMGFFTRASASRNSDFGFISFSASSSTQSVDSAPPSVPTGLSATPVSSSQIDLAWTASTDNVGVAGYKIFRNGLQIATTINTSYSDTGRLPSTLYSYAVAAYDLSGNNSPQAGVTATTPGGTGQRWSHVQTNASNSGSASNSLTFSTPNAGGNLIVVEVDWSSGATFASIGDGQGNVYTQIGTEQISAAVGVRSRLYYAKNIKPGVNTVTAKVSGTPQYHELYIHEYSGLDTVNPLDSFSVYVGSSNTFTSNSLTTTASNELLYGIEIDSSAGAATSGWATRSAFDSNVAADKNASSAASNAFTGTSSGSFICWIVAFR